MVSLLDRISKNGVSEIKIDANIGPSVVSLPKRINVMQRYWMNRYFASITSGRQMTLEEAFGSLIRKGYCWIESKRGCAPKLIWRE